MHRLHVFYTFILIFFSIFSYRTCLASNVIGPDDTLRISVYGYEDLRTETRVSSDGRITFPLIGEVMAGGKTSIELEEAIASQLIIGGFIHNAQVSVAVLERVSQNVSVLGYVYKPGRYPLDSDSSIVDVIAMAGGIQDLPTSRGDNKVVVTRTTDGVTQKFELDMKNYLENPEKTATFKMQKGDIIYVPKAPMFYIYGEVQHPGGYPLEPDLTVVKALSIGGGLTLRGTDSRLHIKRKDDKGVLQEMDADLSTPVLKDDVVYVNERWF